MSASPLEVETPHFRMLVGFLVTDEQLLSLKCQAETYPTFGVGRICYVDSLPGQINRRRQRVNLGFVILDIHLGGSGDFDLVTDDLSA